MIFVGDTYFIFEYFDNTHQIVDDLELSVHGNEIIILYRVGNDAFCTVQTHALKADGCYIVDPYTDNMSRL